MRVGSRYQTLIRLACGQCIVLMQIRLLCDQKAGSLVTVFISGSLYRRDLAPCNDLRCCIMQTPHAGVIHDGMLSEAKNTSNRTIIVALNLMI